jgi:hypothetical protein
VRAQAAAAAARGFVFGVCVTLVCGARAVREAGVKDGDRFVARMGWVLVFGVSRGEKEEGERKEREETSFAFSFAS